ncbi:MAG TPA: aspartyl/asparaginyl beta-hydroxylase domain-containing protein, partial [Gammaproteobacteria bacterium]
MRLLAEQAGALARRGELASAFALYRRILDVDPMHPEAVSFVAMSALQGGDVRSALQLLLQATERHGDNANLQKNLGIASRAAGDTARSLTAFERAFTLQPGMAAAYLNHGALLAELGRKDEALTSYLRGFEAAEATGLFIDFARVPAGIRNLVEKAAAAVRDERLQVFRRALAPLEAEHGKASLARVWHCLESYLGLRSRVALPTGQRPTFMSFPGLPARAWYEHDEFPWMPELERHTGAVREELLAVMAQDRGFRPFVEMPREHPGAEYWKALNHSPDWNAFFFYRDGRAYSENQARCPVTTRVLDAAPLNRVADHSPESLYSILTPGAHIPPHTGVINVRLVVHLPLIVP